MFEQPASAPSLRSLLRRAPRGLRWSTYVAAALVLLLVLLLMVTAALVRRPLPVTDGELVLPGLDAEVEVIRDAYGIPQIYADTDDDLMRAQGFVAAQDRFFEMDIRRHVTAGRLSELFGKEGIETDKYIRTMGWRRVAEEEWALLDTSTRDALSAYAEGVNAYLEQNETNEIAVEYTILGLSGLDYEPEPWEPADSLAWLKAMAWDLKGNMDDEIARVLAGLDNAPERVAELYPPYDAEAQPPIVDTGGVVDGVFEQNASGNATRNPRRPAPNDEIVRALTDLRAGLDRRLTFQDDLREEVWPDGGDRWFAVVTGLLRDPISPWWDDKATEDVIESRDDILRQALLDARDELTKRQALNPEDWNWGDLHQLDLRHSTLGESGVGPLEWLFNREGNRVGGGSGIVNATGWDAAQGYAVTTAPSMRMVVSLADFDRSRYINLTGVSGHPGSSSYDDQTELFVNGDYLPWAFSRDAVVEAGQDTLLLTPATDE